MQHHPIGSFDWKRIVKRAELPRTTKLIAGFLGDFANVDGTGVRPGPRPCPDASGPRLRPYPDARASYQQASGGCG
ncbi:hypothetical protein [Catenulispora pinisilvae]|uniref:hypothetical protein n=1 Tax=Catenulispora pinisilvae TaxID=2705253 RepID=UPI001890CFFB|nr:hypothetical protein [Catenulispora pinisilvae]